MVDKRLTGREVVGLFDIKESALKQCREDGMKCDFISGQYWYNYNDIVEFLS